MHPNCEPGISAAFLARVGRPISNPSTFQVSVIVSDSDHGNRKGLAATAPSPFSTDFVS